MDPFIIHPLACFALVTAAIYRVAKVGPAPTAHRFLFPYIAVASLVGLVLSYLVGMELFVAYYSGANDAHAAAKLRLTGPYGWFYVFLVGAPLLPALAVLPWIGKRPLVVALLGIVAPLPGLIFAIGPLIGR
jgi:hypothetical protein